MAMLREAELAAGLAQHELAAIAQFPADAPLPLPADRPHVGAYRTNYQELFAARPAPDRARLIDRTLPIRRMAIDQRAIAIQAAQDALTAAIDSYQAGQGGLANVISSSSQLIRQQRAFIETVCHYNHDIAEYAMIVAAPGATPQMLVGFMIKTTREPDQSSNTEMENGVRPAALNEPATPSMMWNGKGQPIPAPRNNPGASDNSNRSARYTMGTIGRASEKRTYFGPTTRCRNVQGKERADTCPASRANANRPKKRTHIGASAFQRDTQNR